MDIVRLLLAAKADATITTKEGATPLAVAIERDEPELVACLLAAGASISAAAVKKRLVRSMQVK